MMSLTGRARAPKATAASRNTSKHIEGTYRRKGRMSGDDQYDRVDGEGRRWKGKEGGRV